MTFERKANLSIFAVFAIESMVLGNWIPRIPDIKYHIGLSDLELGLGMLAIPVGTIVAFLFAGRLVQWIGLKTACRVSLVAWALVFVIPGFADTFGMLFLGLLMAGVAVGLAEVAMNTIADKLEDLLERRIMSKCHGFWSLGSMVGALTGAFAARLGLTVEQHFLIVMPLLAVAGYLAVRGLPENDHPALVDTEATQGAVFKLPTRAILLLCLAPLGIMVVEGAFIDWSALFMRDILNAGPILIGVTYAFFSIIMAVTRLSGDWLAVRFGEVRIVRFSGLVAAMGIGCFALATGPFMAFVGATLSGLGTAIVYPMAMSAAARRPGSPADNVAAVSLVAFTSFMLAPPIIGFVSDVAGLRVALVAIVPLAVTTSLLAGEMARIRPR